MARAKDRESKPADDSLLGFDQKGDADEAAEFLAQIATELAQLARRHRLNMLGFLFEMAQLEAEDISRVSRRKKSP